MQCPNTDTWSGPGIASKPRGQCASVAHNAAWRHLGYTPTPERHKTGVMSQGAQMTGQ